jgi:hypothetical protein
MFAKRRFETRRSGSEDESEKMGDRRFGDGRVGNERVTSREKK